MRRPTLIALAVTTALAWPVLAQAQAIPRGSTASSGSSSAGSGSTAGSSGSSGSSSSSSSSSASSAPSSPAPATSTHTAPAGSSQPASHATPRTPSGNGSSAAIPYTASSNGGGYAGSPYAGIYLGSGGRDHNGQPITGVAILRPTTPGGGVSFGPWGRWYPWYSTGFNFRTGYVLFDPWQYGTTSWVFGRYGMWPYDPFYDPFDYPYGYSSSLGYGGSYGPGSSSNMTSSKETGSVRLRIEPAAAQVYVDGVLHGSVGDFNGLSSHLTVDAGDHLLEVKADGYEPYSTQISVPAGKTVTYRASLKKKK